MFPMSRYPRNRVSGNLDFHWFPVNQWGFEVFRSRIRVPHVEIPQGNVFPAISISIGSRSTNGVSRCLDLGFLFPISIYPHPRCNLSHLVSLREMFFWPWHKQTNKQKNKLFIFIRPSLQSREKYSCSANTLTIFDARSNSSKAANNTYPPSQQDYQYSEISTSSYRFLRLHLGVHSQQSFHEKTKPKRVTRKTKCSHPITHKSMRSRVVSISGVGGKHRKGKRRRRKMSKKIRKRKTSKGKRRRGKRRNDQASYSDVW